MRTKSGHSTKVPNRYAAFNQDIGGREILALVLGGEFLKEAIEFRAATVCGVELLDAQRHLQAEFVAFGQSPLRKAVFSANGRSRVLRKRRDCVADNTAACSASTMRFKLTRTKLE